MRDALLNLIRSEPFTDLDARFNALALQIFQYQFQHSPPYQKFCLLQNKSPNLITCWEDIPALPVTAFKYLDIACHPIEKAFHIFHSSGTTQGFSDKRSRHAIFDLEILQTVILSHFKKYILHDMDKMRFCILTPSPEEAPHSSLSYMMEVLRKAYGTEESEYYIYKGRLLSDKLFYNLSESQKPIVLMGTSFSFVHFVDFLMERPEAISLPPGSRLMDTGGFKGKSRTVSKHWLYAMIQKRLGIPIEYCCNEYGMSEITSQFYDGTAGVLHERVYHAPSQTRWQILSPETLTPVKKGKAGLLAIYDLANIDSVSAILTEDMAKEVASGFELIGRASGAEIKGCSIELDTLLG